MKIPNISRRYGGVGIKLKDNIFAGQGEWGRRRREWLRIGKMVFVAVIGVILCFVLYDLVDRVWNGVFVDWFTDHYMVRYPKKDVDGVMHYVWQPAWPRVKRLLFRTLVTTVVAVTVIVYMSSKAYAQRQVEKCVTDLAEKIRRFMATQREADEVFPKEYAEVSVRMAQIRAGMQKQEQAVREEAARKNDLITYLAHDLKTPLTSVIGYLSLLEEAADMPEPQKRKYMRVALEKALRLEKLTNEFFEITRYNLQQMALEREKIDLHFMLMQMTDEFYPLLQAHGNTVRLETAENAAVYGDPEKLARVFQNILKNAIAYSYENTEIVIRVEEDGEWIRLYFQNHGKTIPKAKLDLVFDKFFRLDEARATATGGAGLGLAIAKDIVTLHGGRIMAESEKEITAFVVELPVEGKEKAE